MQPSLLLDTCACIWLMQGEPLAPASRAALSAAQKARAGIYVSPITAWEIGTLVRKNRIQLNRPPDVGFRALIDLPGVRLAAMGPEILVASALLPGPAPRDPADRIIAATARALGYTVMTRDGELVPYGAAGYLNVIDC
jgi:PIN domain nuclease of toxin-antitoxin system